MTELERRALLGDAEAQRECTEKGIVLACWRCGGEAEVKQLSEVEDCDTCKNAKCAMRGGTGKCEWKWRGPQKEE